MLAQINQAFTQGNNQFGLEKLREFIQLNPHDQQQSYRLAVVEEQLGTRQTAEKAYLHCLQISTTNVLVHLYAGYFFLQQQQSELALIIFSLGCDIDQRLTQFHWSEEFDYQTRLRSHAADVALRNHFVALHQQAVGEDKALSLIHDAIWPQTHNKAFEYQHRLQKPHLFYIPKLRAEAVFDKSKLAWCQAVEQAYENVKPEFNDLISLIEEQGEPYLDESYKKAGFTALAGSPLWKALHLYKDGVANKALLAKLPEMKKLLANIPLYNLNDQPYEVFFSLLKARQHITPHYGLSNHSLTVHLAFIVPESGYLRSGEQSMSWQEGKLIVFDDSFDHEAENSSDQDRVVLIFSVWHPDLTIAEQQAIRATFAARSQWLAARANYLTAILSVHSENF